MPPDSTVILYTQAKVWVPFGLMMCLGLLALSAFFLLRPWPPNSRRVATLLLITAAAALLAAWLLQLREIRIDFAAGEIVEKHSVLGIGPATRWPFSAFSAITVKSLRPQPLHSSDEFLLQLEHADGQIHLWKVGGVLSAENTARGLAQRMDIAAQREGYRLILLASGGDSRQFKMADGRQGVQIAMDSMIELRSTPGKRSKIDPLP